MSVYPVHTAFLPVGGLRSFAGFRFTPGEVGLVATRGCGTTAIRYVRGVSTNSDIIAAVDAFMATPKRIVGIDQVPQWGPGRSPQELETKYPLEIEGEQRGAQLMIVGFPREPSLKFRLGILFPAMICRLDYTDETHPNSIGGYLNHDLPPIVTGPHYHSWPINREFFHGVAKPPKLWNAVPYTGQARTFDAVLRWFCSDVRIESLPPDHRLCLPLRTLV
jgi:hypothetical protein